MKPAQNSNDIRREGVNMEDFFEKLKDELYNSMDYIAMLVIVVAIGLIIGWRLDLLFPDDHLNASNEQNITEENNQDEEDESEDKSDRDDDGEKSDEDAQNKGIDTDSLNEDITVNIPTGSFTPQIGSLLESEGIIIDTKEFVARAEELKLETKLRSGNFELPEGSSLDDIIKIISGQK